MNAFLPHSQIDCMEPGEQEQFESSCNQHETLVVEDSVWEEGPVEKLLTIQTSPTLY